MKDKNKEQEKQQRGDEIRFDASDRIDFFMDKRGLTNKEVGEVLGISAEQVRKNRSNHENYAKNTFTLLQIIEFAEHYSIPLDNLIRGKNDYSGKSPLSDILKNLFEADKIFPLWISSGTLSITTDSDPNNHVLIPWQGLIKEGDADYWRDYEYVDIHIPKDDWEELHDILCIWSQLKGLPPETQQEIIPIWQSEALHKAKQQDN